MASTSEFNSPQKEHFWWGEIRTREHANKIVRNTSIFYFILGFGCLASTKSFDYVLSNALAAGLIAIPAYYMMTKNSVWAVFTLMALSIFCIAASILTAVTTGFWAITPIAIFWVFPLFATYRAYRAVRYLRSTVTAT